ncbi:MAG: hypothetical protein OXK76_09525 [Gammaproteobacteria bacterium]|nr:hypothetical protein [Gammaproteobacteria bacterium]
MSIAREYIRLARGRGRITLPEYVQYGVYDPSLSGDDKSRFISEALHWPIVRRCNDITWEAATEDKWLCAQILGYAGVRVPAMLAVIDTSDRAFPATRTVGTARELRDLFMSHCGEDTAVFCKPNGGVASFGAFIVDAAEPEGLHVVGEGFMGYDVCLAEFVGGECYVVQRILDNHPFLGRYSDRLATVRIYMLRTEGDVRFPFAALKVAAPGQIADNYWRPGGLACDVDPQTGVIRTARTKDTFGTTAHDVHPETGAALVGEVLPMWDRIVGLARECSSIFGPVRYASMDVAVLADGPAVVEVNTGGAFNIPQLATGRGFLIDEVLELFRSCGYKG